MKFLKKLLHVQSQKEIEYDYLAESVDLIDLENRIRAIDRGQAPWQIVAKDKLSGW